MDWYSTLLYFLTFAAIGGGVLQAILEYSGALRRCVGSNALGL